MATYLQTVEELGPGKAEILSDISYTNSTRIAFIISCEYDPSATSGLHLDVFYGPGVREYSTEPLISKDLTFSAGKRVMEVIFVECPKHGILLPVITNLDGSYPIKNIRIWWEYA